MKKLLLIGGGGHCISVLDCLLSLKQYDKLGIIDYNRDASVLGIEVVGVDSDLPRLLLEGWQYAFITVGSVGDTKLRRRLFNTVTEIGFVIPTIIDSTSTIAGKVNVGKGTFIGKKAIVNANTVLGQCSIVNTGAIVEHDCSIGDFVHIGPGAILCGQIDVGHDTHIGAGSVVRQLVSIGDNSIIGAGSVVVKNIPDNAKAYGNPCRVVRK